MTTKLTKIALITTALMTQGSILSAGLTNPEEQAEIDKTASTAIRLTTDPAWHVTEDLSAALDKATIGAFTLTPATSKLWLFNPSNNNMRLLTTVTGSSEWSIYEATLAASWNSTTGIAFAEIKRNGTDNPASPKSFVLTATRTGTPADLTRAALANFLDRSAIAAFNTLTGTGTAVTSAAPAISGWAFTGRFLDNSAAAFAGALDPIAVGLTMPLTLVNATTPTTLRTVISDISQFQVDAADPAVRKVKFTLDNLEVEYEIMPGTFVHTASIYTGILGALNGLSGRYLKAGGLYPSLSNAIDQVRSRIGTTSGDAFSDLENLADSIVGEYTAIGKYATALGTDYGLTILGNTDLTNVVWSAYNGKLVATGTIGASGVSKRFEYALTGDVVKDDTQESMKLVSADGEVIYVGCFDSTGLDFSATAGLSADGRKAALADALATAFNTGSITTVGHKTLKQLP